MNPPTTTASRPNRLIRDDEDDAPARAEPLRAFDDPRLPADPPARKVPPVETPRQPRKRRSAGGGGAYPGLKQVTAYIDPLLYKKLRAMSLETDRTMIELMEQALTEHLKSYAAQRKFGGNPAA